MTDIKMNEKENKQFSIAVLLDSSGSMEKMGNEPIEGINNFFKEQIKSGEITATLAKFSDSITYLYTNVKGTDIKDIDRKDYEPNGMTALYDSIASLIHTQKEQNSENVIFIIVTDGEENASKEYKRNDIKALITEMETINKWKFIYLGANQDSFAVGNSIGIRTSGDYDYTPVGCRNMMRTVSDSVSRCVSQEVPIEKFELKMPEIGRIDDNNTTLKNPFSSLRRTDSC